MFTYNPHNPPNDYESNSLVIILHSTFYDKKFKSKKWHIGTQNSIYVI